MIQEPCLGVAGHEAQLVGELTDTHCPDACGALFAQPRLLLVAPCMDKIGHVMGHSLTSHCQKCQC